MINPKFRGEILKKYLKKRKQIIILRTYGSEIYSGWDADVSWKIKLNFHNRIIKITVLEIIINKDSKHCLYEFTTTPGTTILLLKINDFLRVYFNFKYYNAKLVFCDDLLINKKSQHIEAGTE